jgi:homoserine dehydrogenase
MITPSIDGEVNMPNTIKVALMGLGRIGQQFTASLSAHIAEGGKPIKIVAVAERDPESEAAKKFAADGVPVFTDAMEIVAMGEAVDIIFDLTGVPSVRKAVRDKLQDMENFHTVLVPEVFARLLWSFLEDDVVLGGPVRSGY